MRPRTHRRVAGNAEQLRQSGLSVTVRFRSSAPQKNGSLTGYPSASFSNAKTAVRYCPLLSAQPGNWPFSRVFSHWFATPCNGARLAVNSSYTKTFRPKMDSSWVASAAGHTLRSLQPWLPWDKLLELATIIGVRNPPGSVGRDEMGRKWVIPSVRG